MIDSTNKGSDYPSEGTSKLNFDDKKQTQTVPKKSEHDNLGNPYGGKLPRREQDARDVTDNQISRASGVNNKKLFNPVRGNAPKK